MDCSMDIENCPTRAEFIPPQREYGRLIFQEQGGEMTFALVKPVVIIGRDKKCDLMISRREVSRRHIQLAAKDDGSVWITSLGREPVSLNGLALEEPVELCSGDKIGIQLEDKVKVITFEGDEETIQINRGAVSQAVRKPFREVMEQDKQQVGSPVRVPQAVKGKSPRRTPGRSEQGAAGQSRVAPPPPPPLPTAAALAAGRAKLKPTGPATKEAAAAPKAKPTMLGPVAFVPSAQDLQTLLAGLRKTRTAQEEQEDGGQPPASPLPVKRPAPSTPKPSALKAPKARTPLVGFQRRKSVRFNIPEEVSSPEGVPMDATLSTPFKTALGPEVFINVNADNTMAFSEWLMGSDAHGTSATPLPNVTPSREVTPVLRRHSHTAQLPFEESVGRKRRSCSGSRNGTPAVKTPSNPIMDIDGAQESESDEGILPCAHLENLGTVPLDIPEGLQEEVAVAHVAEPTLDGLLCNPMVASLEVEVEPQTEDVQAGPAAETQGPTLDELTAQVAENPSGSCFAAVKAQGCKEGQESLSTQEGGPTIEGLPEGEALFASISMSEDEFVQSILLSQPADADAAQVEESLEVRGMGPAVEMQGGIGNVLDTSGALDDQPLPENVPVEEVVGVAMLETKANVEGLTPDPDIMSRPGPGLQAPACTPASAAGRSRPACGPHVDAIMLAAHLETLSGYHAGDDSAPAPLDDGSAPPQLSGLEFALDASSKPDLGADTTESVEGDDNPLASDVEMTEAAAPTPKLAAAEAADMTVEIPANPFATPFPSRNAGPGVDGEPHISEELHTTEHMNQAPEEAVITAPLCMPEADPAPQTSEIESLKAQLEAANQRAHTYLRKVKTLEAQLARANRCNLRMKRARDDLPQQPAGASGTDEDMSEPEDPLGEALAVADAAVMEWSTGSHAGSPACQTPGQLATASSLAHVCPSGPTPIPAASMPAAVTHAATPGVSSKMSSAATGELAAPADSTAPSPLAGAEILGVQPAGLTPIHSKAVSMDLHVPGSGAHAMVPVAATPCASTRAIMQDAPLTEAGRHSAIPAATPGSVAQVLPTIVKPTPNFTPRSTRLNHASFAAVAPPTLVKDTPGFSCTSPHTAEPGTRAAPRSASRPAIATPGSTMAQVCGRLPDRLEDHSVEVAQLPPPSPTCLQASVLDAALPSHEEACLNTSETIPTARSGAPCIAEEANPGLPVQVDGAAGILSCEAVVHGTTTADVQSPVSVGPPSAYVQLAPSEEGGVVHTQPLSIKDEELANPSLLSPAAKPALSNPTSRARSTGRKSMRRAQSHAEPSPSSKVESAPGSQPEAAASSGPEVAATAQSPAERVSPPDALEGGVAPEPVVQEHAGSMADEEEGAGEEGENEDHCYACGEADEGDVLLLCDSCDNACHLHCAVPPLRRVPKGDWFCKDCKPPAGKAAPSPAPAPQEAISASGPVSTQEQPTKPAGKAAAKRKTVASNPTEQESEAASAEKLVTAKASRAKRGRMVATIAKPQADASPAAVDAKDSDVAPSRPQSPAGVPSRVGTVSEEVVDREAEAAGEEEGPKRGRRGSAAKPAASAAATRRAARRTASVDDSQDGDDEIVGEAAQKPARRNTVSPAPQADGPATSRRGRRTSNSPAQAQESEPPTKRARRVSATAAQPVMAPPTAALPPIIEEEEEEALDEGHVAPSPAIAKPRSTRARGKAPMTEQETSESKPTGAKRTRTPAIAEDSVVSGSGRATRKPRR